MISIKGYTILQKLGSGGMAMVYLAEHEKLSHRVAIKVLSDVLTADKSVRERFLQEARLMASLRHPGIVPVTDFVETESSLALVMDYIEGKNLSEIIGSEVGPIPTERALPLFRQILEATEYAHEKGIVHRDLKPSNVMVSSDGKTRIMDFGIAKIAGGASHTRTGTKLGTLYYMSPEQIRGSKDVDKRTDIYSLGMTLYEMLAGQLPFEEDENTSEFDITQKIVFEEFEPPDTYYPHIPDWLVQVVRKATAKNPNDRYQNCKEFLKALDAGETGVSKAVPPYLRETTRMDSADRTTQDPITLKPEQIQKIFADGMEKSRSEPKHRPASPRKSGSKTGLIAGGIAAMLIIVVGIVISNSGNDEASSSLPSGMTFVNIPSGGFQMGSPFSEDGRYDNEKQHQVYVNSFELMTTEVTQGMWEEVMGESASSHHEMSKGSGANYPMYYVSWNDCQDFIDELNDMDPNHTYRLPSEAEWEYACRAGTTTRFYWGNSDSESTMGRYCWYIENSSSSTHPVSTKQPNAWGLYDMSGNVWEWCQDVYTSDYDDCPTDGSANRGSGSNRVKRGGSWSVNARFCRSANRSSLGPGSSGYYLGFRLARS